MAIAGTRLKDSMRTLVKTTELLKARKKASDQVVIGFGFAPDWLSGESFSAKQNHAMNFFSYPVGPLSVLQVLTEAASILYHQSLNLFLLGS